MLILFHSLVSGPSRRTEAFLAQVLQRRRNHRTFRLYRVGKEQRPDLLERFGVAVVPTIMVVERKRVRVTLENPKGAREIERALARWLR